MLETASLLGRVRESGKLSPEALANLSHWLKDPSLAEFLPEIAELVGHENWDELEDAFYMHLMIGTGGIRGKIGPGPNRINTRTIGEAAQGLCQFIEDYGQAAKDAGVVVGHEARRGSRTFAEMCCEVFAANGVRSFLFDGLRATPEISFAVRQLRITAGVQITASHNPRTDNGFKFYWTDGGQVVPPLDGKFMQLVSQVTEIKRLPLAEARRTGLVSDVGKDVDEAYLRAVRGLSIERSRSATVVFSPIHGAGSTNVLPALQSEGYAVKPVRQQLQPDENFPTAVGDLINPEYREVMELPIRQANEAGADVAICSDPDADRIGVAAKTELNRPQVELLSGNQVGALITQYLLEHRAKTPGAKGRGLVIETFVTSTLIADIAASFGVDCSSDSLVGFKWMAKIIDERPDDFIFACEESIGYLAGNFVRDKDGAIGALYACEMISWLKDQGKTAWDYLDEIYAKCGYYRNQQRLVELPGKRGREAMRQIMLHMRFNPPGSLGGLKVLETRDWLDERKRDPTQYEVGGSRDMVCYVLSEDARSRVTFRPSGTEPKLKYYIQVYSPVNADLPDVKDRVDALAHRIGNDILTHSGRGVAEELQAEWRQALHRTV